MTAAGFVALLERRGFDFFAGVPCSLFEDLIATLEGHPRLPYVAAVREDIAVGVAGGAWFAGRRPAVLMQNSGLGTSLNALASFSLMYGLPALLLITWRGHRGQDAPEHLLMGAITPGLLEALGIPARVPTPASLDADLEWARETMQARMRPVALLVAPGLFSSDTSRSTPEPRDLAAVRAPAPPAQPILGGGIETGAKPPSEKVAPRIPRMEAIAALLKELDDELVVCANGYPSREACAVADRPQNFYMIGSMGLAAAIGLGLALGRPRRRVVVLDGDGNLLMSLGVLANVVALAPPNFVHGVFDNEVYGSTGNQLSPSARLRLDGVARAAGYRSVALVTGADEVAAASRRMLATDGPHFLLAKVTAEAATVPRIPFPPEALRDRFQAAVQAS